MTSAAGAAALSQAPYAPSTSVPFPSSSSSGAAAGASSSASSSTASAATNYTFPPAHTVLRFGGYTLEEAGIVLPEGLSAEERARRMQLLAAELHHEALHPPVLPPSRVPDLPDKPPPARIPEIPPGLTPEEREAIEAEICAIMADQKKSDQGRNNLAAKKSRLLRIESLDNTRLQLHAKAAECAWLRLRMIALMGERALGDGGADNGRLLPSAAWGGSDYVYRKLKRKISLTAEVGGRRGASLLTDDDDDDDVAIRVGNEAAVVEEEEEEEEEVVDVDVEGVVPNRVKDAITEEVRARVEAHRERVNEQKKTTSKAKADGAQTAKPKATPKQPRRSSKSSSKSGSKSSKR